MDDSLSLFLHQLEEKLLQPKTRHSPAELSKLLADEFMEFAGSGIYGKQEIIKALGAERETHFSISDFKARSLSPNVMLVTYRATKSSGDSEPRHSLRSSIWKNMDGNWQMIFHQGTPIPE